MLFYIFIGKSKSISDYYYRRTKTADFKKKSRLGKKVQYLSLFVYLF
jgi:hypothetical protein